MFYGLQLFSFTASSVSCCNGDDDALDGSVRQVQCSVWVHLLSDVLLPADHLVQVTDTGRGHRVATEGVVVSAYSAIERVYHPFGSIRPSRIMAIDLLDILEGGLSHSYDVHVELLSREREG